MERLLGIRSPPEVAIDASEGERRNSFGSAFERRLGRAPDLRLVFGLGTFGKLAVPFDEAL